MCDKTHVDFTKLLPIDFIGLYTIYIENAFDYTQNGYNMDRF